MNATYKTVKTPRIAMTCTDSTMLVNTETPSKYILITSTNTAIDHATTCNMFPPRPGPHINGLWQQEKAPKNKDDDAMSSKQVFLHVPFALFLSAIWSMCCTSLFP